MSVSNQQMALQALPVFGSSIFHRRLPSLSGSPALGQSQSREGGRCATENLSTASLLSIVCGSGDQWADIVILNQKHCNSVCMRHLWRPMYSSSRQLLCPWDSLRKNTEQGLLFSSRILLVSEIKPTSLSLRHRQRLTTVLPGRLLL